jgi:hypothetical protein
MPPECGLGGSPAQSAPAQEQQHAVGRAITSLGSALWRLPNANHRARATNLGASFRAIEQYRREKAVAKVGDGRTCGSALRASTACSSKKKREYSTRVHCPPSRAPSPQCCACAPLATTACLLATTTSPSHPSCSTRNERSCPTSPKRRHFLARRS